MATAGDILRRARQRASMTQAELASRAQTKQSAISKVESGDVDPTVGRLHELVALTGHDLSVTLTPRLEGHDAELRAHDQLLVPEERLELTITLSQQLLAARDAATAAWLEDLGRTRVALLGS